MIFNQKKSKQNFPTNKHLEESLLCDSSLVRSNFERIGKKRKNGNHRKIEHIPIYTPYLAKKKIGMGSQII